jgi:phosphotriesterase family protein
MSLAADFLARFAEYIAATRSATGLPPVPPGPPPSLAFMQDLEVMVQELTAARREGIGCIVDGGHPDMGRSIDFLRQLSSKSQVPIVAGGGLYTQPFCPAAIARADGCPSDRTAAGSRNGCCRMRAAAWERGPLADEETDYLAAGFANLVGSILTFG